MLQAKTHSRAQLAAHEFDILTRLKGFGCVPEPIDLLGATVQFDIGERILLSTWLEVERSLVAKINTCIELTRSLASIHAQGIVYRNMSVDHILVNEGGTQPIFLHLERATRLSRLKQSLSPPSELKGQLAYYSPELTGRINRNVDWRSDLYGLGVLFYEIISGALPFEADTPMEWVNAHLSQAPAKLNLPGLPTMLSPIVMTLLEKDPEKRYASIQGLIFDLERVLDDSAAFTLKERDFAQSFALPDKLYGREKELQVLESALDRLDGTLQNIAIAAPSGMGKTALVEELRRTMAMKGALLCSGKFDQYAQGEPFSALAHAVDDLARQVLRWETSKYEAWRKRVLRGLNGNGRILTDLSPMMERILGEQPQLPDIDAELAPRRNADTFYWFFQNCAAKDHPVIFFIDDLQWVDSSTMGILNMLKDRGSSLHNILMIHAYRSNEIVKGSAYSEWLDAVSPQLIEPQALSDEAVQSLLRDGFCRRMPEPEIVSLAHLLGGRSGGSPFFLRELISSLVEKEAVRLNLDEGMWHYDQTAAAHVEFSADVAELLLNKMKLLPEITQRILSMMSYVGRDFTIQQTIDCAQLNSHKDAANALWPAVELDLIAPLDEGLQLLLVSDEGSADLGCRFVHDKIQAASKDLLPVNERALMQQTIAFRLLGERDPLSLGQEAIVLADLLRESQLTSEESLTLRRRLQLRAGMMARKAAQIPRAADFLLTAWKFQDAWQPEHKEDSLLVMNELAETYRASTNLDGLIALDQEADALVTDKTLTSSVAILLIATYCTHHRLEECIARIKKLWKDLDFTFFEKRDVFNLLLNYVHLRIRLKDPRACLKNLPRANPRAAAIQWSINAGAPAALTVTAEVMPNLIAKIARLILTEGYTANGLMSAAGLVILSVVLGDFAFAKRFVEGFNDFLAPMSEQDRAKPIALFAVYAWPYWRCRVDDQWESSLIRYTEALLRAGDIEMAAAILNGLRIVSLSSGQDLTDFRRFVDDSYPQYFLPGEHYLRRYEGVFRSFCNLSRAKTCDFSTLTPPSFDGDRAAVAEYFNGIVIFKTLLGEPIDEYTRSMRRKFEEANVGEPSSDRSAIFYEISCIRYGAPKISALKDRILDRGLRLVARHRVRRLHRIGYESFVPLAELLWGCQAEARGKVKKALQFYESAYHSAQRCGSEREALLAAEYSMRLLQKSQSQAAVVWLQRALTAAENYGFLPKRNALREEFADDIKALRALFPHLNGQGQAEKSTSDDLDLATLIAAGADLAKAKDLPSLVELGLSIVIKNLSATRAQLWQQDGDTWTKLGGEGEISAAFLDEVYRAKEIRVIDDASETELSCQSALCIPMASGNQAVGLLVIENDTLTEAFPRSRLPFLRTLSNQIATAIANALLYAQMEEKVQEKARAMVAIMTHIEQGILTIEASGKIADDYSSALPQILGLTQIAGRDAMEILFGQAELATDVVDQVGATLFSALGEDVLNFEVNAERLISEFSLRSGKIIEVDWVPIVDDFEEVRSIMVTLRDVTQVRASQAAAEASAMELKRIGSLLALSPRQVSDFFDDARTRLEASKARVEQSTDPSDWLELNFRDLHTLKGVSRSYQFLDLAAMIHEVEEPYQTARQSAESTLPDTAALSVALAELLDLISDYERIEHEVLKRQGASSLDLAGLRVAAANRDWQAVDELLTAEQSLDLEGLLAPVIRSLPTLAKDLGRPEPQLIFDIQSTTIDPSWSTTLLGALTHVLRNSVDHGLKTADSGEIHLAVAETPDQVRITIEDAGRGLNLGALEKKLGSSSDEDLAEAIFRSGLSTNDNVSEISGRGVGMDAVRAALEERGGRVMVEFVSGARDAEGYRKHRLVMVLPKVNTNEAAA